MKLSMGHTPTYYVTFAVENMVAVDESRMWVKEQLQLDAVRNARIDSEWLRLLESCDIAKQACWSLFLVACKYRNLVIRHQHRKHAFWNRLTKPLRGALKGTSVCRVSWNDTIRQSWQSYSFVDGLRAGELIVITGGRAIQRDSSLHETTGATW